MSHKTITEADRSASSLSGAVPSSGRTRPLRVLHVLASLNLGGVETWLMEVMRHRSREALTLDVCTTRDAPGTQDEEFMALGGAIHRCPLHRNPWAYGRRLEHLLRTQRYDVVHSHLAYFSGCVLRSAARAEVPIRIAHYHTVPDPAAKPPVMRALYYRWMRQWIERYGTHFVAVTQESLDRFWEREVRGDPRKRVLHLGIAVERFRKAADRAAVRKELGLPREARLVLNVGRFIASKRQGFLVEVAERVVERAKDVYFVLIGAGPVWSEVEQIVAERGLSDRVRMIPAQPGIDRFYLAADLFAFPSSNEGLPLVVAEAAAAGLHVIALDIPGMREAADACGSVELLPVGATVDQWTEAVLDRLNDPPLSLSERLSMLEHFPFTIEASIRSLNRLYGVDES